MGLLCLDISDKLIIGRKIIGETISSPIIKKLNI